MLTYKEKKYNRSSVSRVCIRYYGRKHTAPFRRARLLAQSNLQSKLWFWEKHKAQITS